MNLLELTSVKHKLVTLEVYMISCQLLSNLLCIEKIMINFYHIVIDDRIDLYKKTRVV